MDLSLNPITIGLRGTGRQLLGIPTPSLDLDFINSSTLDSRITFTRASDATYFDSSGVLQTAASGVARFDHNPTTLDPLGLLIEEQRTNSIRNNTMQGAVAGTPGTLPTNWSVAAAAGLTTNVIGTGTSQGVTYVDLQVTGTTSATSYILAFEASTQIAASSGQTWAWSSWIAFVGGSLSNITTISADFRESNSGGTQLAAGTVALFTPTASLIRQSATRTLTEATTAFVQPRLRLTVTNGAAIDITLRIGLPQLELGAFATSVIPTTTVAATRNADVASMTGTNFSSWFRADEGTLFVDYSRYVTTAFNTIASISDGTNTERMRLIGWNDAREFWSITDNNSLVAEMGFTSTTTLFTKLAGAYKVDNFAFSRNGATAVTDTSGALPVVSQLNIGATLSSFSLNGHIRKIAFYPTRLSNAQLVALTR